MLDSCTEDAAVDRDEIEAEHRCGTMKPERSTGCILSLTAVDVHRDALAKQQAASASQIATAVQETQAARCELQEVEAAWAAAARGLENERNLRVYGGPVAGGAGGEG